jgi:hypothetical protein
MRYDSSRPVAVFLGPSVDRATAEKILPANYYPPVRMGDVYRLAATRVRTILIIDGVFHWVTPVWQREIRNALENGIGVIGAASMGALRAAELGRFGMIGRGTIWSWYRDSILDGDDEVALLHGDETVNYRPMSEPLVNIRYNLGRAVDRGVIDERQAQQLLDRTKQRYFGARSYRVLLDDARALGFVAEQMGRFERFLADEAVDLKRVDAIDALTYCAELAAASDAAPPTTSPPTPPREPETDGGYSAIASLRRGVRAGNGDLVDAESVLKRIASQPERLLSLRRTVAAGFFLSGWAADHGVDAPVAAHQCFRQRWVDTHVHGELSTWLATVGLTAAEFDAEMRRRAAIDWLMTSDPGSLGLDFEAHRQCVALLSPQLAAGPIAAGEIKGGESAVEDDAATVRRKLAEACYVASWARERGIDCPRETVAEFVETCEAQWGITSRPEALKSVGLDEPGYLQVLSQRACYHWAVDHGPNYFGYSTFSYPQALLTELQLTNGMSALVDASGAS